MKKLLIILGFALFTAACGDGDNNNSSDADNLSDPNQVHPEAEAVPDSLKIVNDSTIMPDSMQGTPSTGTKEGTQN